MAPSCLWHPPAWRLRKQPESRAAQQLLAPTCAPKTARRNCACCEDLSSCRSLGLRREFNSLTADDTSETLFFSFHFFFLFCHFGYISTPLVWTFGFCKMTISTAETPRRWRWFRKNRTSVAVMSLCYVHYMPFYIYVSFINLTWRQERRWQRYQRQVFPNVRRESHRASHNVQSRSELLILIQ